MSTSDGGALAGVPASTDRHALPLPARLKFFYGPMDCGKSTLALQINHNYARQGRAGLILTRYDRSGDPAVTTRVGLRHTALEITDELHVGELVRRERGRGRRVDYLIIDEAGFLNPAHVEQLADLVDDDQVDVYCFGLATDFRSQLLPGAKRLFELADEIAAIQVEVLCWCGRPGQQNARVIGGRVVREGDTVVVADTVAAADTADDDEASDTVHYQVLCRLHFRDGNLGWPATRGQLRLPD